MHSFGPLLNGFLKLATLLVIVTLAFSFTIDSYAATHVGMVARVVAVFASLVATAVWFGLWKVGDFVFALVGSQTFDEWFMEMVRD